jgi:uncharacterized protein YbjT (DUF2867 family)
MYAITGITGKVGGELARTLLEAGEPVRAVVRNGRKGEQWAARGCEVALAEMADAAALTRAFNGAAAVFVLLPPTFDPQPGFPEARAVIDSVMTALQAARPVRVLCLSTIGADAAQENLLSQLTLMEAAVRELRIPVTILRPAWFIDNAAWDLGPAREAGTIQSFLSPTTRPFPMVAASDVGRVAARLMRETWTGIRTVELEGPTRVSPNDLADAFASALGKPVHAVPVPRETWAELFRAQGMKNPEPRIRMLDGFNEGWIDFSSGEPARLKGSTTARDVVAALVAESH